MYLKLTDILHFGVDELEVYATLYNYKKLFEGIDDENSDFITFGDYTVIKTDKLKDYECKFDFIKDGKRCFAFYVGKKINEFITTKNYFKVYGIAFRLLGIEKIIEFINSYMINDEAFENDNNVVDVLNLRLKRFDLAFDVKKNLENEILPNIAELKQKGTDFFGSKGEIQTHYIGEYKVRDNRGFLIRIYDKKADIKKKGKQALYGEYLEQENVTRLEIEFRTDIARSISLEELLDTEYLFNLFIIYIEKHTKMFNKLKTQDVKKLSRFQKRVDIEQLKVDKILQENYINIFLGYSKKIKDVIGYCPTKILIMNYLMTKKTKEKIVKSVKDGEFDIIEFSKADE